MRYVSCMSALWRLSENACRRMLKDVVRGEQKELGAYGKRLGWLHNVSDIEADEAVSILVDLGCRPPKAPPAE